MIRRLIQQKQSGLNKEGSRQDEATRADSFDRLVLFLERGNRTLNSAGIEMFETSGMDTEEEWNSEDRVQALYTLVR